MTGNRDEFRGAPDPPAHEHAWTRVYRRGQQTAHIRELLYSAHPRKPSSWDSTDSSWYGTGSYEEYERAARMPTCAKCFLIQVQYEHG